MRTELHPVLVHSKCGLGSADQPNSGESEDPFGTLTGSEQYQS